MGPQAADEFRGVDFERLCQQEHVVEGGVDLAPLDVADVRAVEAGPFAQLLLRKPEGLTCDPDALPELDGFLPVVFRARRPGSARKT